MRRSGTIACGGTLYVLANGSGKNTLKHFKQNISSEPITSTSDTSELEALRKLWDALGGSPIVDDSTYGNTEPLDPETSDGASTGGPDAWGLYWATIGGLAKLTQRIAKPAP